MEFRYKIELKYDGSAFYGFQKQKGFPSVQGSLERALRTINSSQKNKIIGCSRTDRGVHADQYLALWITWESIEFSGSELQALNQLLSPHIKIVSIVLCGDEFQPIHGAKKKTYHYYCSPHYCFTDRAGEEQRAKRCLRTPKLNVDMMHRGCELFKGEHDFSFYQNRTTPPANPVREMEVCRILPVQFGPEMVGSEIIGSEMSHQEHFGGPSQVIGIEFISKAFMRHQVRLMTGHLIDLALGRCDLSDIKMALTNSGRLRKPKPVPGHGLVLKRIFFDD